MAGFQQAIDYFQQAIAKDPNYAPAYAGLANSYTLLGSYSLTPTTQYTTKAGTAILRALKMDDTLPEAHVALAFIVETRERNYAAHRSAVADYRRG